MTKVFLVGKIKLTFVLVNEGLLFKINFLRRIEEMKKFSLVAILLLLVVFMGCTKETPAEYFDYYYDPNREGIVITGFSNKEDILSVVIPKRINKHPVTCIGKKAFRFEYFKSITIPNTVIEICDYAFGDCRSLTSVTIPDSVTKIGELAFRDCTSLTTVTIPDSITEINGFGGCTSLTSVNIPGSVTKIGRVAFSHCSSLTSITIPDGVTEIGREAFSCCANLTTVTIPNSVKRIESYAFYDCTNLTNVTIPDSVKYIAPTAFEGTGVKLP